MLPKIFAVFFTYLYSVYAIFSIPLEGKRNSLVNEFLSELDNSTVRSQKNSIHPSENLLLKTFQYYGNIDVGTPGQNFKVSFSTLSSYVYIPSNRATPSCGPKYHNSFIESDSTTFKATDNYVHNNPSPYTELQEVYDVVTMDKMAVKNQTIALILDGNCDGLVYDGVLGLGFSVWKKQPTFLDNLYNNHMISQKSVGLRLNRDFKCSKNCGEIVLGGWNNRHIDSSSVRYIQAAGVPESLWKITLDKVLFGSLEITKNQYAVIDISTSFIRVPATQLKLIVEATSLIQYHETYLIDKTQVKNLPSLTFNIAGKDYTLTGADYVDTVDNVNGLSIVLLKATDGIAAKSDVWILGDAFVGKYYTIFDYQNRKVAFANINGASGLIPLSFMAPLVIVFSTLRFFTSS